ncbi:MAG TPA: 23S rRNA (guanosine(2251)-2'-O)-methyltransferase RlmB [Blastocatellia bacterium]|nr:23S rRNA (guanosine(2251)-2'-O)-methyltransferase RlmB [Blastocatellia bacterium]
MANIYGVLPVLEALRAGARRLDRILIAEGSRDSRLRDVLDAARRARVPIRNEPRVSLDRLTHNANHQGVVAITSAASFTDVEDLLKHLSPKTLFILLDGVEDPHNLGAIIRTAECGGASAVIIPQRRAVHLTDAVAKSSAGAIEHLPVSRVTNLASFIMELKKRNVWVIGVESSGTTAYNKFDFRGATALVFGGEGGGLHRLVRERCDAVVSIPMYGKVASLNVSVAVGIVLFEAIAQRERLK